MAEVNGDTGHCTCWSGLGGASKGFPRYFAVERYGILYVQADAEDWIVLVSDDGTRRRGVRLRHVRDGCERWCEPGPVTMVDVRRAVRSGFLREITAAEAERLYNRGIVLFPQPGAKA